MTVPCARHVTVPPINEAQWLTFEIPEAGWYRLCTLRRCRVLAIGQHTPRQFWTGGDGNFALGLDDKAFFVFADESATVVRDEYNVWCYVDAYYQQHDRVHVQEIQNTVPPELGEYKFAFLGSVRPFAGYCAKQNMTYE